VKLLPNVQASSQSALMSACAACIAAPQESRLMCFTQVLIAKPDPFLPGGCHVSHAGTLPANLMSAFAPTNTMLFNLEGNQFYGTLPDAWGAANRTWDSFSLANNWLTGSIPESWTSMVFGSRGFDLSSNYLSGTLPQSWGNATAARPDARWGSSQLSRI
jgi:hypothetical protein